MPGWLERFGHKVNKGSDPGRRLVLRRVNGIDVGIGCVELGHQLKQLSLRQMVPDVPFGTQQDAVTVQRPLHGNAAVVGGQVATRFDRFGFALSAFGEFDHPIGLTPLANADEVVLRQVGGCFGLAVQGDIGR